jgi:phenylpropionate dioxygenase-like ring-hydroxylating dioxygenase large terminal subunit
MTSEFVQGCWYVIATTEEVGAAPLRRALMGDAVVLYRTGSGDPVALTDRCIHCGAPLSQGTVAADKIACPYHGLVYDASGVCVKVPSQPHVPDGIRVRRFPTYDDGVFVWIWPGIAAASALAPPPRLPAFAGPNWSSFSGATTVGAALLVLHEHLLDITHFWVGLPGTSPAGLRELSPLDEIEVSEATVSYHRMHPPTALAAWEAQATGLDPTGRFAHRDSATFVSPGLQLMTWDIDGSDGTTFEHVVIRALTPESTDRTRVSWLAAYNYADRRPDAVHTVRAVVAETLQQDAAMAEMVQANIGPPTSAVTGRSAGEVSLLADAASLQAARIIRSMIAQESGREHSGP